MSNDKTCASREEAPATPQADRYTTVYNAWALMKSERHAEAFAVLSKLVGHEIVTPPAATPAAPGEVEKLARNLGDVAELLFHLGQTGWPFEVVKKAVAALSHPAPVAAPAPVPYDKHEAEILAVIDERDHYHDMADQLAAQIAAITGDEIGEHSSDNNPWRNAMLSADEWIARDLRAMFAGEAEPRRRIAAPAPASEAVAQIAIDFKQATELLEMFGGEPCEVTLRVTKDYGGLGLYAHYTEYPEEGAAFLGVTDGCATPTPGDSADAPVQQAGEWSIDHSAGRPILVHKNCSVIEAEDAEYVLRLIAADRQHHAAASQPGEQK